MDKLEGKIEEIIELILKGKTFRQIAKEYGVVISTVHKYLSLEKHSARAKAALELSANTYANKAEKVLKDAKRDSIEMTRARELAQHYRWMAGKRNPRKYGDKMSLDVNEVPMTPEERAAKIAKLTALMNGGS